MKAGRWRARKEGGKRGNMKEERAGGSRGKSNKERCGSDLAKITWTLSPRGVLAAKRECLSGADTRGGRGTLGRAGRGRGEEVRGAGRGEAEGQEMRGREGGSASG